MQLRGSEVQCILTCDWSVVGHSTVYGSGACVNLVVCFLLPFKFCIFAANYFSCSRTCRVLVSFHSKHLVSEMRQRKDISSIAWISANGNALLIYLRKFVAPVRFRYSVVKTGHITFHSNVHQQSGWIFCKRAIQETPWRKNWLLKTMAETENRGKP